MNTYIIAEIGINHNGDINIAKELIDISKNCGCNAVKFQKRTIDIVYSQQELDSFRDSPWGKTNRDQKNGLEFSIEQYVELEKYTNDKKLDFIVSCWDLNSLIEVEKYCNVKYHKIASAMLTDIEFLKAVNDTKKKVIISTGMSSDEEVNNSLVYLNNVEYILACTSTYPTNDDDVNLNYISTLKLKYPNYKIGFSNHSNGLLSIFGSVALGAECVEFHITKDRTMYGSDQPASIENVDHLISGVRKMEVLVGNGVKKVYDGEIPIRKKLRRV